MMVKRKAVSINKRTEPCQFCGYPLSQRHHALPVHIYGENVFTLQLCANCHELYHIVQAVFLKATKRNQCLLQAFIEVYGNEDIRLKKCYHFISSAIDIAKEQQ